jgi:hypothetical protein
MFRILTATTVPYWAQVAATRFLFRHRAAYLRLAALRIAGRLLKYALLIFSWNACP